jgi:hypothetical protein
MIKIQDLPDHKAYRSEIDKYLDEPLLEYVWKVADAFLPVVDHEGRSESQAPVIFANRCIEAQLSNDEKFARYVTFFPNENIESAKKYYTERPPLDQSFKERFFNSKEVIQTIEAYHLNLEKFGYLLLFINDVVEDVCTNGPTLEHSETEKINTMISKLSEATELTTKKNGRQNYETHDEYTLSILKTAITYFINSYNTIIETSNNKKDVLSRLNQMGVESPIKSWILLNYKKKVSLAKSHKTRLFAAMFQYFLSNKIPNREFLKSSVEKISTDKLLFISRLTSIVGLQGEDYYHRYSDDGGENRKLSNLLNKYKKTPLPSTIGWIYSGGF